MILYLSARNSIKGYNKLSGINTRNLFPHSSGARSPRSGHQQGEVLVRTLSSQDGFSVHPQTGWGVGKRDRGKDTQTQRQKRKLSGVSFHGDTKPIG